MMVFRLNRAQQKRLVSWLLRHAGTAYGVTGVIYFCYKTSHLKGVDWMFGLGGTGLSL